MIFALKPSPRLPINQAPINRVAGGATVLTDPRNANGFVSPRIQKQKEREEYKRLWEQHHPEVGVSLCFILFHTE